MGFSSFFFVLLLTFLNVKALEIPCEKVERFRSGFSCKMDNTTETAIDDMKISDLRNEKVIGMLFNYNGKISFLPIDIHEKMPNLLWIFAIRCSISAISKKNFNNLSQLGALYLGQNKIQRIDSDTFDDLWKLKEVHLGCNQIKFISGNVFEKKPELEILVLTGNVCIDKDEVGIQKVQSFLPEITAKCGESNLLGVDCRNVPYSRDRFIGGNETVRGKWPFLVALIFSSNGKYFCSGNLISSKHVLTAAHCLNDKNQINQLAAEDIAVLLGRHDLKARYERDSEQRDVTKIVMHPNWKNFTEKYDSDLALLLLHRKVEFSDFIQPVCITRDADNMDHFAGIVVGWGKSESEAFNENIPRQVSIRAVNTEVCFEKDPSLGNIYSRTTFCAGGEGVGPCTGDSGGGFFVHFQGIWTLRGIVSGGTTINGVYEVGRFTLFTKLVDFSEWIRETMERI